MVHTLVDICLRSVGQCIGILSQVRRFLPWKDKERLIERMCSHRLFTPTLLPSVTYHLFAPELKSVCLEWNDQVIDGVLVQLSKCGCQLRYLKIDGCKKITDDGISALLKSQFELVHLELKNLASGLKMIGLRELHAENLAYVELKSLDALADDTLKYLTENCLSIKVLLLRNCRKVSSLGITPVAATLKESLECINLTGVHDVSDDAILALAEHCPNLTKALCHGCSRVSGSAFVKLVEATSVASLELSFCFGVSDTDILSLAKSPVIRSRLKCLELYGLQIMESTLIRALGDGGLNRLAELHLSSSVSVTDAAVETIVSHCGDHLAVLDLSTCSQLTDRCCQHVSRHCRVLQNINFSLCSEITAIDLLPLIRDRERGEKIKVLTFTGCRRISLEFINAIADHCPFIEVLLLAGVAAVDDGALQGISRHCRQLRFVGLKGCTQVTDEGVCALAQYCPLRMLVISGIHALTDKVIFSLASHCCSRLEEIYMAGCAQITPAAVRYLQDCCVKRPWVHHKIPNAAPDLLMAKNLDTGEFCKVSSS